MTVITLGESMGLVASLSTFTQSAAAEVGFCGAESNVAIGLARLGHDVTWFSRLGDDSFGRLISTSLTGEGVRVRADVDTSRPTGVLLKEQRTPQSTLVTYLRAGSAASALQPELLDPEALGGINHLHLTGITPALGPGPAATALALLSTARERGATVSFDVNHRSRLWSAHEASTALAPFVRGADVLFAGEDEAALFVAPGTAGELCRRLADLGPSEVVLKLGDRGALALADGAEHSAAARPVAVVDTVGAGDAFVAGYLSARFDGLSVPERLHRGTTTAAFACLSSSDWQGAPRRDELGLLDATEPVTR